MNIRAVPVVPVLVVALFAAALQPVAAQTDVEMSYIRGVADHFDLPATEVRILTEWDLPLQEIPVVLTVAERAGVSPDAVVSLRRGGRPWADLAARYGLDASHFHIPLVTPPPAVSRAYESFGARDRSEWPTIRLEDSEIVFLTNVSFLSRYAGVPAQTAADILTRTGSAPAALRALGR